MGNCCNSDLALNYLFPLDLQQTLDALNGRGEHGSRQGAQASRQHFFLQAHLGVGGLPRDGSVVKVREKQKRSMRYHRPTHDNTETRDTREVHVGPHGQPRAAREINKSRRLKKQKEEETKSRRDCSALRLTANLPQVWCHVPSI